MTEITKAEREFLFKNRQPGMSEECFNQLIEVGMQMLDLAEKIKKKRGLR